MLEIQTISRTYLQNSRDFFLTEAEYFLDVLRNCSALWCDTARIEVHENVEQFVVLNNGEWAAAVGNPKSDLHPMACGSVPRAGSKDCQGTGLARIDGGAALDMTKEVAGAFIVSDSRDCDRGVTRGRVTKSEKSKSLESVF